MAIRDTTIVYVPPPRWTIYFDADGDMLDISAVRDGLHADAVAVEVVPARPSNAPASTRDLREPAKLVVKAWTAWIDSRSEEWTNSPDDPHEDALDDAVGDLGRLVMPEMYG